MLKPGVYKHFKGNYYRVHGTAFDTETMNPVVVYTPMYECELKLFVRPLGMFTETVLRDGVEKPRFSPVSRVECLKANWYMWRARIHRLIKSRKNYVSSV